jgi:hypothetical protein
MHYIPDGRVERRELVAGRSLVSDLAARLSGVAAQAVPFNEWLVRAGG